MTMNRKSFLAALFALPTMLVAKFKLPTVYDRVTPIPSDHPAKLGWKSAEYLYREYALMWTGWKSAANTIDLYGQWYALPLAFIERGLEAVNPHYKVHYASCPGTQGRIGRGETISCFSIDPEESAVWCAGDRDLEEPKLKAGLERAKASTLARLLKVIDADPSGIKTFIAPTGTVT
jgi:hypothetical protein